MDGSDTISELFYIIQRFLSIGPCSESAKVLKDEIELHELLPKRIDYSGKLHSRSFEEYSRCLDNLLPKDYLKRLCIRLPSLLNSVTPSGSLNAKLSLIGCGRHSLLRQDGQTSKKLGTNFLFTFISSQQCLASPRSKNGHISNLIASRQFSGLGTQSTKRICTNDFLINRLTLQKRFFGHLSSVFCVAFDRSGQYIFTGADDHLIKLWLVESGRLLFTFRGLSSEVTDLTISHENTLLAAGSCDKTIRVWCLRSGSPIAVLQGHSAMITTLQFLPYVDNDDRWLLSTGNDCSVCFWKWNVKSNQFILEPIKYSERLRVSGQMVCSSHSPGGRFIVAGGTDFYVRVYVIRNGHWPERIIETEGHTDRVSTVQWGHRGLKFVTGSRDGVAKIWRFSRQEWKTTPLLMDKRYEAGKGLVPTTATDPKNLKLKVTMLTWSMDDALIVSAVSDMTLRVWDAQNGTFLRLLLNHTDEVFVLEPHPVNPKIILSAGHDGVLILWDITTGEIKKRHFNEIENSGHGAFFDARFACDGDKMAAVDSHGHLLLFGADDNHHIRSAVTEQFFHTDYRPLIRDANLYALDEQTQLAPHLMPPPFLVNSDGDPHPPAIQRRVPGRESFSDDFLVPVVIRNAHDDSSEIVDLTENPAAPVSALPRSNSRAALQSETTGETQATRSNQLSQQNRMSDQNHRLWNAWLSRALVRPLTSAVLEAGNASRVLSGIDELLQYETELAKSPRPLLVQVEEKNTKLGPRRRTCRVSAKATTNELHGSTISQVQQSASGSTIIQPSPPIVPTTSQIEANSDDDSEYSGDDRSSASSSASTSSFSCSDYDAESKNGSDNEVTHRDLRSKQSNGKCSPLEMPMHKKSLRKRGRQKRHKLYTSRIDEEDDDSNDQATQQPSTSSAVEEAKERPKRTKKVRQEIYIPENLEEKKRVRQGQRVNLPTEPSCLNDVPDKYWFPEWITCTVPRKTPYFPQIKDQITYFPVGHSLYIDAVERLNLYPIDCKSLPWNKHHFQDQEFAIVMNVRFEITPVRLCCLKLAQVNPMTGLKTGLTYTIRYHDIPNVIDFIVLRQHFEQSLQRRWKEGDRFQAVIDDNWWFGTIVKKEPFDQRFPNSIFLSFKVLWDNGDEERLSPWDLELFDSKKCPVKKGACVPLSEEELCELAAYEPKTEDWPVDRERDIGRLCKGLGQITQFSAAEPFAAPVDLNAYPTYCLCVEYPSDLTTIKTRLDNYFYRRIQAVEFDIKQIHKNAVTFNEPRSQIVHQAKIICEVLTRFLRDITCEDIAAIYNEVASDKPGTKDKLTHKRPRSKKSRRRKYMSSKDDETDVDEKLDFVDNWVEDCKKVLDVVKEKEQTVAVGPNLTSSNESENSSSADDMNSIVSLKIIQDNLGKNCYSTPQEFLDDLFACINKRKVDKTSKRSKTYLYILRLKGTITQMMQPILKQWQVQNSYSKGNKTYNTRNKKIAFTQIVEGAGNIGKHKDNIGLAASCDNFVQMRRETTQPLPEKRRRVILDQSENEATNDEPDANDEPSTSGMSFAWMKNKLKGCKRDRNSLLHTDSLPDRECTESDQSGKVARLNGFSKLKDHSTNSSNHTDVSDESQEPETETIDKSREQRGVKRMLRVRSTKRNTDHISTRYKGRHVVKYAESSDDDSLDLNDKNTGDRPSIVLSTSSRGRVCKLRKFT